MNVPAEAERVAATIRLRRSAVWASRHVRIVEQWATCSRGEYLAEHGGRYFRVERANSRDWWDVLEITAAGAFIDYLTVAARNLPAARLAIALTVAGAGKDEVARRALNAPGAPTGRTLARKRDRERAHAREGMRTQ